MSASAPAEPPAARRFQLHHRDGSSIPATTRTRSTTTSNTPGAPGARPRPANTFYSNLAASPPSLQPCRPHPSWIQSPQSPNPRPAGVLQSPSPRPQHAQMATTDSPIYLRPDPSPPMTTAQVIAYVKKELEADDERQAQIRANADLPAESQTGSTVDLSCMGIHSLPIEVVLLIKDKVERLVLSRNLSCRLPKEIVQCDRLRFLNLSRNKLERFPDVVLGLRRLEILDISKNEIQTIPDNINRMTSLKFLAMTTNQITRLPLTIGEMTNLVKIKFDENPLEFPPPEALQLPPDHKSTLESEKEKELCAQVKKYLRSAAIRERMKVASEDDLSSEGNIETPRPSRRIATGGRFPVRPSMSGIDLSSELSTSFSDSPPSSDGVPPIPLRSHARGGSGGSQAGSRPGTATNPEGTRSRSETVATSESMRSRRRGYLHPSKHAKLGSVTESASNDPFRLNQAANYHVAHSRNPSSISITNSLLSIGGDISSGGASPSETLMSSFGTAPSTTSLAQSIISIPRSSAQGQLTLKVIKRLLCMVNYLYHPIADTAQQIRGRTPKRSPLERSLFSAKALADELAKLTHSASRAGAHVEVDPNLLMSVVHTALTSLKLYTSVAKEVKRSRRTTVQSVDPFHIRCMINVAHSTAVEAMNLCDLLGYGPSTMQNTQDATPRVSQVWSQHDGSTHRSVRDMRSKGNGLMPTKDMRSLRDPTPSILPQMPETTGVTSLAPLGTDRYTESYASSATSSHIGNRSNTMQSIISEGDGEEPIDRAFYLLRHCCDLAQATLPGVRTDLVSRKSNADSRGQSRESHNLQVAITKCEMAISTNDRLIGKLRKLHNSSDPARLQRDIWAMCEMFAKDWAAFAEQVMRLAELNIDISHLKRSLKPVQKAVKETTRLQTSSAAYSGAGAGRYINQQPAYATTGLHGFPYSVNPRSVSHPMPATPLAAALGQAAQTILPSNATNPALSASSSMYVSPQDYFHPANTAASVGGRSRTNTMHDRGEGNMPISANPRR